MDLLIRCIILRRINLYILYTVNQSINLPINDQLVSQFIYNTRWM